MIDGEIDKNIRYNLTVDNNTREVYVSDHDHQGGNPVPEGFVSVMYLVAEPFEQSTFITSQIWFKHNATAKEQPKSGWSLSFNPGQVFVNSFPDPI